uniref:Cuticle protein n=1 Tax=Strigamia maritima TaxID=126957 RepID=T1JPK5_STRMM
MALLQVACICFLVVVVSAFPDGYGHHGAPYEKDGYYSDDGYGKYKFGYNTADHHTGDVQGRHEEGKAGHEVHGSYYQKDPYGYIRKTDYKSVKHGGTYQAVKGSYNGLYVHSPYFSIVPEDKGHY